MEQKFTKGKWHQSHRLIPNDEDGMYATQVKRLAPAFASVLLAVVFLCGGCTNENDFNKGKRQLEQQGYTDVKNTGYSAFCCDEKDTYSSGFTCKDKDGNVVKGCICSGIMKGVTIRYE